MIDIVVCCIIGVLCIGLLAFFLIKRVFLSKINVILNQSHAKILSLESEIQRLMSCQFGSVKQDKIVEQQVQNQYRSHIAFPEIQSDDLEQQLTMQLQESQGNNHIIEETKRELLQCKDEQRKILMRYKQTTNELISVLENYTSLTKDEAKSILLRLLEDELHQQKVNLIRRYEREAKDEAEKRANFVIAQATTRFAGEYASERLINVVNLPSDDLKGRIIGKDGRNIKALEMISGVNIIIEDVSNVIILSSFNIYRRAIAAKTLEILIADGRIHPARIEEVYTKVREQIDEQTLQDAENIVIDLGIGNVHLELKRLIGKLRYRASFGQNALSHSLEVARIAGVIASELGGDWRLARRAGLLHDIGKALTDEIGGSHVDLGAAVCLRYKEHPVVINAIRAHHGHEESESIECSAVCTADILSAARPGARLEVVENYLNRVQDLERIAMQKFGVKQAYAINAGREIRVIVCAELIDDSQAVVLAREIVKDIQQQLQYHGGIKVNVIREVRAVEFA
ncbi:ribonuclease Y [Helicobacter aurati]|uniref:Ribonuclease Y n=1 Tax=Helicobacter aurati TaxID=137778 RepID=A0A3D8J995_9HELI|nr:ribonuclease Y [Helicobacter aurati]RDU73676.1 ribonuclease Y [Helicobacter aurati]